MASSQVLRNKCLVDAVNFEKAECIVELGPGTGPFTREIVRRKKAQTILILIEINEIFFKKLRKTIVKIQA